MPFPPLPDNATARAYLTYTSKGFEHTASIRPADEPGSDSVKQTFCQGFAEVLALIMNTDETVIRAEWSPAGTNVRFPVPFDAVPGTRTLAGQTALSDPQSRQISVCGKGNQVGRRWRLEVFTAYQIGLYPDDNRDTIGDGGQWDDFMANIVNFVDGGGGTGISCVTIADEEFIIYPYVNTRFNAHWQNKQRS